MSVFKKIKKFFKGIFITLLILILLPVVAILAIPLWIGPVVRPVVNKLAPEYTKTDFYLGKFHLNPYTCFFEMGDLRMGNPEGFEEKDAVKLGTMLVDVDTLSLATDVVVIEKIELSDVYVSYVKNAEGKTNFEVIGENCKAKEAAVEAEQAAEEQAKEGEGYDWSKIDLNKLKPGEKAPGEETAEAAKPEKAPRKPKKYIVKELKMSNISGTYLQMPFRMPSFTLRDMGKDSGGYDLEVMEQAILKEFIASIMASFTDILNGAIDLTGQGINMVTNIDLSATTDAIMDVGANTTDAIMNVGTNTTEVLQNMGASTGEMLQNVGTGTTEVLQNVGTGTTEVLQDVGTGTADALKDVGSNTTELLKNMGTGTTDALKGVGTSTADALKDAGKELKNAGKALKGIFK